MMKTWQILLLSFAGVCALVLGSSLAGGHRGQLPQRTPEIVTVTPQRTPAPGEFTNYYTKQRAEYGLSLLQQSLPGYNPEMRYDNVNGWLFYDLTNYEIDADFIQGAKDGTGLYADSWAAIVDSVESIQRSLQKIFTEQDDDTVVVVDILNPDNTDEVWLSVANGIAGYDVVNGIDLLNDQD